MVDDEEGAMQSSGCAARVGGVTFNPMLGVGVEGH